MDSARALRTHDTALLVMPPLQVRGQTQHVLKNHQYLEGIRGLRLSQTQLWKRPHCGNAHLELVF